MVEVSWRAVRADRDWKRRFEEFKRRNMTRPQFTRHYLIRLDIGDDSQLVALDPKPPHRLASMDKARALFPELVN